MCVCSRSFETFGNEGADVGVELYSRVTCSFETRKIESVVILKDLKNFKPKLGHPNDQSKLAHCRR